MIGGNGREPRRDPEPGRTGPPGSQRSPGGPGPYPLGRHGSLAELVLEIVGELADVSRVDGDDETVWRRAGRSFASLAGGVLELRLQPLVARAALRTPDTHVSERGEGWLRFGPSDLDRFAADRAAAWLESAWRHAAD